MQILGIIVNLFAQNCTSPVLSPHLFPQFAKYMRYDTQLFIKILKSPYGAQCGEIRGRVRGGVSEKKVHI